MLWYEMTGKENDVVVSSRVRLARNLADYPFGDRLDEPSSKEIIEKVKGVFDGKGDYSFTEFNTLSDVSRRAEADRHKVSHEFASKKSPTALIESDENQVYIMVLEEDHLRIQSIKPGAALSEAYSAALEADRMVDANLRVAYDEKLGYLTHCPTNLGTGMRASVMLFLPAITATRGIRHLQDQLGKIGLTIRGMSGEGSGGDGCLYQVSNQITLGTAEEEIITKLEKICENIAEKERELRGKYFSDVKFNDRAMRAYGTMLYAVLMDSAEMTRHYADVRLAAALGMIDGVNVNTLDKMLIHGMPGVLTEENENIKTPADRDRERANMIRRVLNGSVGA